MSYASRKDFARPNRRAPYLQLRLDRYFTSPSKPCHINDLPLELLGEILVYVAYDTVHEDILHCDPITLPDTHWKARTDDGNNDKVWPPAEYPVFGDSLCIAELRFHNGCREFCSTLPWNWLEVTRVCKRWRDAAHSSPAFWSRIPLQNPMIAWRSIGLSGTLPLSLIAHFATKWQVRRTLDQALRLLHRTNEVSLTGQVINSVEWDYIASWLCSPAPELQRLHLESYAIGGYRQIDGHRLFACRAPPNLREVQLRGFLMPQVCGTLLPATLTSLVLEQCSLGPWSVFPSSNPAERGSSLSFFDALARMPLLEVLSVTGTRLPEDLEELDVFVEPERVNLSHLRQLTFQGSLRAIYRVLVSVDLPITTSIVLWFQYDSRTGIQDDSEAVDVSKLLAVFEKHLSSATREGSYYEQTKLRFSLEPGEYAEREVSCTFINPRQCGEHALPERMQFVHFINGDSGDTLYFTDEIHALANSICDIVPHNGPDVALEVSQAYGFEEADLRPDDWLRCAASMTGLTHLHLDGEAGIEFFAWLIVHEGRLQHTEDTPQPTLYPLLASLKLSGECHITDDGYENSLLSHVLWMLEHHKFAVSVKGCLGDFGARKKLCEVIGEKLEWDWKENELAYWEEMMVCPNQLERMFESMV
ncbi:unnamed protein product [Peniophora sp. CBMAI 1063]|nr:unnamed protein product [Peniophora sp. CBMAI 1063]